jgi:hypothetical protein
MPPAIALRPWTPTRHDPGPHLTAVSGRLVARPGRASDQAAEHPRLPGRGLWDIRRAWRHTWSVAREAMGGSIAGLDLAEGGAGAIVACPASRRWPSRRVVCGAKCGEERGDAAARTPVSCPGGGPQASGHEQEVRARLGRWARPCACWDRGHDSRPWTLALADRPTLRGRPREGRRRSERPSVDTVRTRWQPAVRGSATSDTVSRACGLWCHHRGHLAPRRCRSPLVRRWTDEAGRAEPAWGTRSYLELSWPAYWTSDRPAALEALPAGWLRALRPSLLMEAARTNDALGMPGPCTRTAHLPAACPGPRTGRCRSLETVSDPPRQHPDGLICACRRELAWPRLPGRVERGRVCLGAPAPYGETRAWPARAAGDGLGSESAGVR